MKKSISVVLLVVVVSLLLLVVSSCRGEMNTPTIFTVTFHNQDATMAPNPTSKTVESPATTVDGLPAAPTKDGYIFGGWFTAANGGGSEFTASTVVTKDITVFAKWNTYSYTITYVSQDATTDPIPTSKTVESPATTVDGLPAAPTKDWYTFGGWFTAANGEGSEFTASTVVTEDITLYAKWNGNLTIRDIGPSGGYVFYDKGEYTDGWRYLEAAHFDYESSNVWGGFKTTVVGGTDTGIGTGDSNTRKIVHAFGDAEPYANLTDYAAKVCAELVVTKDEVAYDDWFLPSKDELHQMFLNLKEKEQGGFSDKYYWSSSENSVNDAWGQYFYSGYQNKDVFRSDFYWVRPVRAF